MHATRVTRADIDVVRADIFALLQEEVEFARRPAEILNLARAFRELDSPKVVGL